MKKNLILYIVALATLLTSACTREPFPGEGQGGFKDGETGLVLNVRSTNPETRAIAPPTTLNEYTLEQFYYFIYKDDPSENTSEPPVYLGKWTGPEGYTAEPPAEGSDPIVGTEQNIVLDDLTDLKSADGNTYSGYVYIIANYKVAETLAAWDAIIASATPDYSTLTWTNLQALPLPKPTFEVYNDISGSSSLWPAEQMNEKADEGHRFKAQDSFVMTSVPTPFSVTKGTPKEIPVDLKRIAAKISLDINLAQWYVQTNNGHYNYTWYSKPERVQVYLNYAADSGTMDGEPIKYTQNNAGDFFVYRRFAFLQDASTIGADGYKPIASTYVDKEPLKWLYKANPAETQPETDGLFYTSDEDLAGKVVEIDGKIQYLDHERPAYKITGTPFYSYPYDFSTNPGYAPFFKVIVEWDAFTEDNPGSGDKDQQHVWAREFYYKITIPSLNGKPMTLFEANKWYKIDLELGVLGSESDETAIDLVGEQGYYVVDWSDPGVAEKPDLNAGRYLSVTSAETEKIGNEDVPVFHMYGSAPFEIPMTSSHEVEIVPVSAQYSTYSTDTPGTGSLTKHESQFEGQYYMITPKDLNTIELKHSIVSNVQQVSARDVSVITYIFKVQHEDNGSFAKTVKVIQYPSIYIKQMDGGNAFLDGFFQYLDGEPVGFDHPIPVGSGYRSATFTGTQYTIGNYTGNATTGGSSTTTIDTPYGRLGYDGNFPTKTTLVTVTTFDASSQNYQPRTSDPVYTYTISDPRVDNNWGDHHLIPYLTGQSASSGNNINLYRSDWVNEENIKVGSGIISSNGKNLSPIAPAFLISSRWGRAGGGTFPNSLEQAEQRCATYQEAGYPAGRWRLPTEAEIYFVYQLQQQSLLGTPNNGLFTAGGYGYMASSGRKFGQSSYTYFVDFPNNETNGNYTSFRCVYDYWYWGEQDRNVYKFTPKP